MSASECSTEVQTGNRRSPAEHLRPYWFQPGQSGNPKGRPKAKTFEELVRAKMLEKHPGSDHSNQEELADKFVEKVVECEPFFFQLYIEREWAIPKNNGNAPETAFDKLLVYMIEQYEARLRLTAEGERLAIPPQSEAHPLEAQTHDDRTEECNEGEPSRQPHGV